jgi:hypothetical protein
MAKEYTQFDVDNMFNYIFNGGPIEDYDDCKRIVDVIKKKRGRHISVPAAHKFWTHRSNLWDAGWLMLDRGGQGDDEILEYWDKFIADWHKDSDDAE